MIRRTILGASNICTITASLSAASERVQRDSVIILWRCRQRSAVVVFDLSNTVVMHLFFVAAGVELLGRRSQTRRTANLDFGIGVVVATTRTVLSAATVRCTNGRLRPTSTCAAPPATIGNEIGASSRGVFVGRCWCAPRL